MASLANPSLLSSNSPERKLIGEILVEMGKLDPNQLSTALIKVQSKRLRLAEFLVQEKLISETDLAQALALQNDIPFRDLSFFEPADKAKAMLPEKVVRRFLVLPIEIIDSRLILAVYNPIDIEMIDLVERILKMPIALNISPKHQLLKAIERSYRNQTSVDKIVQDLHDNEAAKMGAEKPAQPQSQGGGSGKATIETLLNRFLEQGVREKASDIHLDPAEGTCRVRMRIDGVLHEMHRYPLELHAQVISRIKVLSGLDIAEKRNAQDGRLEYRSNGHEADVRVSTLPTIRGEKAVMRLLDKRTHNRSLVEVGMNSAMIEKVSSMVKRPYGIVFLTGPTGSGKTTSLYSMLGLINGIERNVITVEDPIEFTFDIINQVQVNEKAGVTFPTILRNILRQDPDVMMIGEVRDTETADIAIRAALTGHLVLSTLHTNNAISAVSRLIDMKIEPFLLSSCLLGVLAQRLVRLLCKECKSSAILSEADRNALGAEFIPANARIPISVGCDACHHSGYRGRVALFEMIEVDPVIKKAISELSSEIEVLTYLKKNGFKTMREDGIEKILAGVTTAEEVLRATF